MIQQRIHNNKIEVFITDKDKAREFQEEFSALKPGHQHDTRVRMGISDGKVKFYRLKVLKENGKITGWLFTLHMGFLGRVCDFTKIKSPITPDYSNALSFLKSELPKLPFRPYKHQMKMFVSMASNNNKLGIASTSAGKSLVIYLLAKYYHSIGKTVLIIVPTVDLTTQLKDDFKEYAAPQSFLDDVQQIGGDFTKKDIKKPIVISTYQSAVKTKLSGIDVAINDEVHLSSSDSLLQILSNPFKIKLGMTGSPPVDKLASMQIEKNFGQPELFINARQLIDLGLATNVSIVPVFLHQKAKIMKYQDEVTFIKDSVKRNAWVTKFLKKLNGLSIATYSHTAHGENIYEMVTGEELTRSLKGDFEKQKSLGVFFIFGGTPAKTRAKILQYVKTLSGKEKVLVIGQQKLLSTGISVKPLKNLVFLSSTKSYATVIQSIGRVLRLHESKNGAVVWDLVDDFTNHGKRKKENYGLKHFWQRLSFYEFQGFDIHEREFDL